MSKAPQLESLTEGMVKPDEIKKLDAYFKRVINPQAVVKARPRKNDSAEVYLGEEFLGVVYVDDEDGDRSYNFSMVHRISFAPAPDEGLPAGHFALHKTALTFA
jgi:hypothetical protein